MLFLLGRLGHNLGLVGLRRLGGCGLYNWDEFVEQVGQWAWPHDGLGGPEGDEVAAGAEFADGFIRVVFVAEQCSSFFNILESVVRIHRQVSVSANRPKSPKQKPNKNARDVSFFAGENCIGEKSDNIGRHLRCCWSICSRGIRA